MPRISGRRCAGHQQRKLLTNDAGRPTHTRLVVSLPVPVAEPLTFFSLSLPLNVDFWNQVDSLFNLSEKHLIITFPASSRRDMIGDEAR